MIPLYVYVFAAFGLAYIVGFALVSRAPREWLSKNRVGLVFVLLAECPACFGFWTGFLAGGVGLVLADNLPRMAAALTAGLFTAGTNLALASFAGLMPKE